MSSSKKTKTYHVHSEWEEQYLFTEFKVWDKAATPANVKAGFEATGIFPFNPDRIPEEEYAPSIPTHNFAEPGASPSENQENGDTNDSDATNLLIPPQENEDTNESDVTDASGNSPYPPPNEDKGNSNPSNDSSDLQPSQAKRCAATPDNASDDHPQHPNQEDTYIELYRTPAKCL
ncbi:unnamed protein product [Acanthoscelides obtectus]|uniref:Uncharacterized protein n=1 Tax=Acanthoscelides obtectus TaxID=200917 RepID=A0A9P0P382_ACAOB|nr:unnamed protein product [Acanthoscelides obtectus]CAK1667435.1 hypothetical protein AOBTE_LOCUS25841 [Acanthoscelides obtectus]